MSHPPLDADAIRRGLADPWRRVEVVAETGSTNTDLLAAARSGHGVEGAVLIAEHQTAGRGRGGRQWSAKPRGVLTMSVGVAAGGVPTDAWGWLPLATGLAVTDAVAVDAAGLKWPNDVLVDGRKLAGILAEVAAPEAVIVVGIGLNVLDAPDPNATSLSALGAATDRTQVACALLAALGRRVTQWRSDHRSLADDYRARSATIGSRVRALLPGGDELVGTARTVDAQGRLVIDADGHDVAVSAGDIVHLR